MDTRIGKLREYLFTVVAELNADIEQINADMLGQEVDNYSLDKIPTASTVLKWITGTEIHKDTYSFRSRNSYSQDVINNLENIGFYEKFEEEILNNNRNGILPDIEGIETIECLNCGTLRNSSTNTAEFNIQIQITYRVNKKEHIISL